MALTEYDLIKILADKRSSPIQRQKLARAVLGRYMTRKERGCMFKRVHTEESALAEQARLRGLGEDRARAYRCDQCGEWHVGKVKQSRG